MAGPDPPAPAASLNAATATSTTNAAGAPLDQNEIKRIKAQMGQGLAKMNHHSSEKVFLGRTKESSTITDVAMNDAVYFRKCSDCTYVLRGDCTKIFIESCERLSLVVEGRVLTHTMEVWKCRDVQLETKTSLQTLQVDMCERVSVRYARQADFGRMVWSACEELALRFDDSSEHQLRTGTTDMMAKTTTSTVTKEDQFVVRLLANKISGTTQLLNELVVRLANGFPTTEREARQFDERQEANLQALARELLGKDVVINKKKQDGPKVNRNEACSCGSGKKYKKCCGTNAV